MGPQLLVLRDVDESREYPRVSSEPSPSFRNLQDKWKADTKMIQAIDRLPGKETKTERVVKKIMQAKKRLKL